MKHVLAAIVLVAFGVTGGVVFNDAYAQKKKPAFKENIIGSVPTEYGKLKGIAGAPNNVVLAFETDKGEVFLLSYRGNKLAPVASKINRDY